MLVVEDEPELRSYLDLALRCCGFKVELVQDGSEALERLRSEGADIAAVLLNLMTPNFDGAATLREIHQLYPELPVIIISGSPFPSDMVSAMKNDATDFLCKPVSHEDLQRALARALDGKSVDWPRRNGPALSARAYLGKSPRMSAIQSVLGKVGWSDAPVLIQGET